MVIRKYLVEVITNKNLIMKLLRITKKSVLIFSLFLSVNLAVFGQSVLIVDNNQGSGAQYTTVQTAVDAASAGDIIYLQPSPNSYGHIQMNKSLKIYGIGHLPELNAGARANVGNIYFRTEDASGSKISGLNIQNIYLDNTTFNNHDVVITNNRIRGISGNSTTSRANNAIVSGNFFYDTSNTLAIDNYNSQNWIISNNTFSRANTYFGYYLFYRFNNTTLFNNNIILTLQNGDSNQSIQLFNSCSGTQLSNNIFLFSGTDVTSINFASNTSLNFQNNLTYSFNTTLDALSGTNNINNTDPQFVAFTPGSTLNLPTNDYHIQSGSPAENAGTDGNDLGVFNGGFPFSIRGYPTELPYITDFVIFNNIISAGTSLNINIKANANINN